MSKHVKWGVLGAGRIARAFAKGVEASETGLLHAVGSRSQASADKFGDEFKLTRRHASYEALLADPEVDAVYIATPHPMHAEWAIKAAQAGKHILCEKPLTLNYPEAMAVVAAAERHGVFLMEAFMYRCQPLISRFCELLKSGIIGQIKHIYSNFSFQAKFDPESRLFKNELGGGGILDVGCYPVSFARLVAGIALGKDQEPAEPLRVVGAGHLGPTGVDEYATAILTFAGDLSAQVFTGITLQTPPVGVVFGTEGRLVLENPWTGLRDGGQAVIQHFRHGQKDPELIPVDSPKPLYAYEVDMVGENLVRKQAVYPGMTWEDSLGNMKVLDQWREAIGLTYEAEKPQNWTFTASRQPLRRKQDLRMPYGQIPGLDKPVSRLVQGFNHPFNIAHLSVRADAYFEAGGNTFDTAHGYARGDSERLLGWWIRHRNVREQVVILAKGAHTPNCSPEGFKREFAITLERFQTDYVDLYCLHRDNPDIPVGEFVDVLHEAWAAGKIKVYGGSNWTMERMDAANAYAKANGKQPFRLVSNNFSLAEMQVAPWAGCLSMSDAASRTWLEDRQLALLPWSSLAQGFFAWGAPENKAFEYARCWYSEANFQRQARAQELAKERGVDVMAVAMAYVLHQPFPTFPLMGPQKLSELRDSLKALELALTPGEVKWLNLESASR
jgi:predicted dehydrogenase/aryl-alcohol dehydrogenase-like predicted oxidoreductase